MTPSSAAAAALSITYVKHCLRPHRSAPLSAHHQYHNDYGQLALLSPSNSASGSSVIDCQRLSDCCIFHLMVGTFVMKHINEPVEQVK